MELVQYLRLFRRWSWLILLAAFIVGSVSFINTITQPPRYRTNVTITVGNYLESPNPDLGEIRTGLGLVQTYATLVRTFDVLNGVVEALELSMNPETIKGMVTTNIVEGTSLLRITVTNTDPVLAADIANEIAVQLILQSPTNLTPAQQEQVNLLNVQINAQTEELQNLRSRLSELDTSINRDGISEEALALLREQRNVLVTQINEASANIAQFTNTVASFQQRSNSIEIVESALIPSVPIRSNVFSRVVLATIFGAALAFGGILVYEYINDTLRSADDVTRALNLPVLGVIAKFGKKDDTYASRLISNMPPFSQTAEEYRTLRANVLYSTRKDNRVFVVSSASPEEGKSVTSANLAVSMALSGLRVLLVDADLRRPKLHTAFGLQNQIGLSNLLTKRLQSASNTSTKAGMEAQSKSLDDLFTADTWKQVVNRTSVPNLFVITSGYSPVNPSELLGSILMRRWIKEFRKPSNFDVVVLDSPPALALSDSTVLAASVEAEVLLIVQAGRTRRSMANRAKERFDSVGGDIVGVVLNNANLRDEDYYGFNYQYYYSNQGRE